MSAWSKYLTGGFEYDAIFVNNYTAEDTLQMKRVEVPNCTLCHVMPRLGCLSTCLNSLTLCELIRCKVDSTSDCRKHGNFERESKQ